MRKRILSLLLCIVLCLSFAPTVAFAYSAGDIPGTTGTGTESDPVVVDDFYELRTAMHNPYVTYIRVDKDIALNSTSDTEYNTSGCVISQVGTKYLQLDHDVTYWGNYIDDNTYPTQFLIMTNGYDLTLTGTGTLTGKFNRFYRNAHSSVIYGAGTTTIDGPTIIGDGSIGEAYGLAVHKNGGKLVVISGTLKSHAYYPWSTIYRHKKQYADYPLFPAVELGSSATFDIHGGTLISSTDARQFTPQELSDSLHDYGVEICENVHAVALDVTDAPSGTITGGVFYNGIEQNENYSDSKYGTVPVDFSNYVDTSKYKIETTGNITRVEPKYSHIITFNMNGHGNQIAARTVNEGEKTTKPADPTASGWTFDGWYADDTLSTAFDFNTAINADTTIYAKWTQNTTPPATTCTITFDANGGSGSMSSATITKGGSYTLPTTCGFTAPDGKKFDDSWEIVGWPATYGVGSTWTFNNDTVIKPVWVDVDPTTEETPVSYTITFDKNGGIGTMSDVTLPEENDGFTVPECAFEAPEGKEFDKWEYTYVMGGTTDVATAAPGDKVNIWFDSTFKAIWKDVAATHTHAGTLQNGSSATCTETGVKDYYTCSCGKAFEDATCNIVIANLDAWKAEGGNGYIAPKGHGETEVKNAKEATCTEAGYTGDTYCKVCGEKIADGSSISAKGHTEVTIPGKAATCTEAGLIDGKKCSVCGTVTVAQETITAKGHTEVTIPGKAATCTETGLTDGKKCSVCGTVTVAQETIAAKGHTFSGNTCTVCGYTKSSGGSSSGGSSSGSSAPATYAITVADSTHGSSSASAKTASAGDTVKITVSPDKGYTLETITVTDKNGKEIDLTATKVGETYTFKMPAGAVEIEATFMDDNTMLNYFVDVTASDYYYDAVLWAAENGITGGVDAVHFAPNSTCTRAQAVTFLWRAAGRPEVAVTNTFGDVVKGSYYEKAVAWAVANGITFGTSATTFSPDADCTRAQIVCFLHRANKVDTLNIKNNPFTDVKDGAYYYNAVLWAAENGITGGTSATTFSPDANCTRAQIVTFLYRFMNK